MGIKKPQLVKVEAFAYFFEGNTVVHLHNQKNSTIFIINNQGIQAWNKSDEAKVKSVSDDMTPCLYI